MPLSERQFTVSAHDGALLRVWEFGADLGFQPWREIGVNPYGNSIIVNNAYLQANRERVAKFTSITLDWNPSSVSRNGRSSGVYGEW